MFIAKAKPRKTAFHFSLEHDILDWVAEKAYMFAGHPDEPELSLE